MAGTKEIRVKIASVKSTQKITKAMQMVATSKMRRAQDRMRLARPYADKIRSVIGNLTQANPDYHHPFLQERQEVKNVGVIVISSDRGLCGSLNINIFKQALTAIRDWQAKGASISMCVVGGKATAFFRINPASRIITYNSIHYYDNTYFLYLLDQFTNSLGVSIILPRPAYWKF